MKQTIIKKMRCLANKIKGVLLFILLACFSAPSFAQLDITDMVIEPANNKLYTRAQAKLKLNPDINDAINNGIKVYINYEVKLREENTYILADATLHTWVLPFSIQFHSLSNQYLVSIINSERVSHHLTIKEALDYIASQLDVTIPLEDFSLDKKEQYYLSNQVIIDKDKLPNLLKIYASINPTWSVSGDKKEWPLPIILEVNE